MKKPSKTKKQSVSKSQELVINSSFGGFSLSPLGLKTYCEFLGKPCYFFTNKRTGGKIDIERFTPASIEEANKTVFFNCFTIPNPNEVLEKNNKKEFHEMNSKEKRKYNELYTSISINGREIKRDDPFLIKTVKKLGKEANGKYSN